MTPLNPPFKGGKFSPPPREGELEGVNLDILRLKLTMKDMKSMKNKKRHALHVLHGYNIFLLTPSPKKYFRANPSVLLATHVRDLCLYERPAPNHIMILFVIEPAGGPSSRRPPIKIDLSHFNKPSADHPPFSDQIIVSSSNPMV
jgi:hypothetical protein